MSCAGITRDEFLLHMSEDDWDKVIAVNLKVVTSEPVTSGPSSLGRELEEDCHPADRSLYFSPGVITNCSLVTHPR